MSNVLEIVDSLQSKLTRLLSKYELLQIENQQLLEKSEKLVLEVQEKLESISAIENRYESLRIANAPGTIDSDYRGEIKVIMTNIGRESYTIHRGERIAQLVVSPVVHVRWQQVETLAESNRGEGGFGHSGKH